MNYANLRIDHAIISSEIFGDSSATIEKIDRVLRQKWSLGRESNQTVISNLDIYKTVY